MKKKNKVGERSLTDIKADYIAIVIKTVWYWWKDIYIDQGNGNRPMQICPTDVWQKYNGKNIALSTNDAGAPDVLEHIYSPNYET